MDVARALDSIKTAEIAWTRVHAIINHSKCLIHHLSEAIDTVLFATRKRPERPIFGEAINVRFPSDGREKHREMDAPDLSQQSSSRSSQDGRLAVDPNCDCDLTATMTCDRDHPPNLKSASDGS